MALNSFESRREAGLPVYLGFDTLIDDPRIYVFAMLN
jgi:hypothetical protein